MDMLGVLAAKAVNRPKLEEAVRLCTFARAIHQQRHGQVCMEGKPIMED